MAGRDIAGVAAVHAPQAFKVCAATDMAEARVRYIHWHDLGQRWEPRQCRERCVVDILATHSDSSQRGHRPEGGKSPARQVRALASPNELYRSGTAQSVK